MQGRAVCRSDLQEVELESSEEDRRECFHGHDMVYGKRRDLIDPLQDGNPCIVAGCEQMDPGVERGGGDLVVSA
ncbi:MAG: hypothetical protein IJ716_08970 [Lachnospiraceae bacterium]|nr:hypothetical protein [Lachnospiraceae bacterium]